MRSHMIKKITVKGVLIDKNNGIVNCQLTAAAAAPVCMQVLCMDPNGSLTESSLCKSFQDLIDYFYVTNLISNLMFFVLLCNNLIWNSTSLFGSVRIFMKFN